jgi:phage head maturation protease
LVLDGAIACLPAVPLPVDVPLGDALDRILAVGADLEVLLQVDDLEGAEDSCELGTLIGLRFAIQALRDVSIGKRLVSMSQSPADMGRVGRQT